MLRGLSSLSEHLHHLQMYIVFHIERISTSRLLESVVPGFTNFQWRTLHVTQPSGDADEGNSTEAPRDPRKLCFRTFCIT